jgi:hypothetical protein
MDAASRLIDRNCETVAIQIDVDGLIASSTLGLLAAPRQ